MKPHYIKEFMGARSVLMKKDYDEWCFLWALIRLVYPQDRHTHYKKLRDKYLSKFDLRGITAPLTFKSISRLHQQNPWLNATFLFVYLDPENKKYLYSSIGLFRQRSENRLEVRYTNGKSRKTRRNKKNWTNKSRKWIKTLRLLSNGTKSCEMAIETERIHQLRRRPQGSKYENHKVLGHRATCQHHQDVSRDQDQHHVDVCV